MMQGKRTPQIEHPGSVSKIAPGRVFVTIESQAACGQCRAKSHCGMVESAGKTVEVHTHRASDFHPGQEVTVAIERSLGYKALLLGYIYPFLILLLSLFSISLITGKEGLAALAATGLMIPYYCFLYRNKKHLRKTFTFQIKPESENHNRLQQND